MNDIYTTKKAAEYLGLTVRGVKYHVYEAKDLVPDDLIGHALIFTKATLDAFKANKRSVGKPAQRAGDQVK